MSTISGITVTEGNDTPNNDVGVETIPVVPTGSISGMYFLDEDGDGTSIPGTQNPGVADKTVMLLDASGAVIKTTTTDQFGDYTFTGLDAGDYTVMFEGPDAGTVFTEADVANPQGDAKDSDVTDFAGGKTDTITLAAGEDKMDVDAGIKPAPVAPGSLSGTYFMDNNDNDVQDGGDMAVAGVLVTLVETGATVETDVNGDYSFGNLAPGSYTVEFTDPNGVLAGKQLVAQDDPNGNGDDTNDSDASGDTTLSTISGITVTEGNDTPDNDVGAENVPVAGKGSIAGRYFCDENGDALEDAGEAPIADVRVFLYSVDDRAIVGRTVTDANGEYSFTDLDAGRYHVRFLPSGKDFVAADVGGDDTIDSDVTRVWRNGTGRTDNFDLAQGETKTDVDAGVEVGDTDPNAVDDIVMTCADTPIKYDVLANDSDAEGAVTIAEVDGQAIAEGQTINVGGVDVMLMGGQLQFDGSAAFASLIPGEKGNATISYTVVDTGGNEATADVDLTFCGAYESRAEIEANLPGSPVTYTITDENSPAGTSTDAYTITVSGTGDARFDGVSFGAAYCIDIALLDGSPQANLTGALSVVDDTTFGGLQGLAGDEVDNVIEYMLNTDWAAGGYTDAEVQGAFWALFDDNPFVAAGAGEAADALAILDDALANGTGYVAGEGDQVAVLVTPDDAAYQPFVIGLEWQDCLCV